MILRESVGRFHSLLTMEGRDFGISVQLSKVSPCELVFKWPKVEIEVIKRPTLIVLDNAVSTFALGHAWRSYSAFWRYVPNENFLERVRQFIIHSFIHSSSSVQIKVRKKCKHFILSENKDFFIFGAIRYNLNYMLQCNYKISEIKKTNLWKLLTKFRMIWKKNVKIKIRKHA